MYNHKSWKGRNYDLSPGGPGGGGGGNSGGGATVGATPKLKFKPASWHNFIHEFLPCWSGELVNNFIGDYEKGAVTAGTVAATAKSLPKGGPLLVLWTGINAFKAGAACAVASRAVYE